MRAVRVGVRSPVRRYHRAPDPGRADRILRHEVLPHRPPPRRQIQPRQLELRPPAVGGAQSDASRRPPANRDVTVKDSAHALRLAARATAAIDPSGAARDEASFRREIRCARRIRIRPRLRASRRAAFLHFVLNVVAVAAARLARLEEHAPVAQPRSVLVLVKGSCWEHPRLAGTGRQQHRMGMVTAWDRQDPPPIG